MGFGVSSREWVVAFWIILGIVVVAILGLTARAVLAILVLIALTMLAARACSHPKLTYFNGLRVVASINPSGETFVGQLFVLPALAILLVLLAAALLAGSARQRQRAFDASGAQISER